MSSWRQLSRRGRLPSSAGLTILCPRADDLGRPRGGGGSSSRMPRGSSAGTTPRAAPADTVISMRSLLARLRSLDPTRADALLALVFLAEVAFELLVFVGSDRPYLGIAVACELVLAA